MNTNIYGDFQIYISVPLILLVFYYHFLQLFLEIPLGIVHCTKNEEIFDGKLHFLCSDSFSPYAKFFKKTNTSYILIRTVCESGSNCRNFAYILNAQSLTFSSSFSLKQSEILVAMSFPYLQICLPKI